MLYKVTAGNFKDVDSKQGIVVSYPSTFGVLDEGRDIVEKGAFKRTINAWGPRGKRRIKALYQHEPAWLVGKPIELVEDDFGLLATTQFSTRNSMAKDVLVLIEDEVITEQSIGYDIVKKTLDEEQEIRRLLELKLYEYSFVTWGMNEFTPIVGLKSPQEKLARLSQSMERFEKALRNGHFESEEIPEMMEAALRRWKEDAKTIEATIWENANGNGSVIEIRTTGGTISTSDSTSIDDEPESGKPFGLYEDFDACVRANSTMDNPEAFCAWLHRQITGEWPGEKVFDVDWVGGELVLDLDEVSKLCPDCGEKMMAKGLSKLRVTKDSWQSLSEDLLEALLLSRANSDGNHTIRILKASDFIQTFNSALAQRDLWELKWRLIDALDESIRSILESDLQQQDKIALADVSLEQFHQAMLQWVQKNIELQMAGQIIENAEVVRLSADKFEEAKKMVNDLKSKFNAFVENEQKEGRVLSGRNRALIEDAIAALQALLESATQNESEKSAPEIIDISLNDDPIYVCPHCEDVVKEKSIYEKNGKLFHRCSTSGDHKAISLPEVEEDSPLVADIKALLENQDSTLFTPGRKDSPNLDGDSDEIHSSLKELLDEIRSLGEEAEAKVLLHEFRAIGKSFRRTE